MRLEDSRRDPRILRQDYLVTIVGNKGRDNSSSSGKT